MCDFLGAPVFIPGTYCGSSVMCFTITLLCDSTAMPLLECFFLYQVSQAGQA